MFTCTESTLNTSQTRTSPKPLESKKKDPFDLGSVPQSAPDSYSISSGVSSAEPEAPFSNERSGDGAPAALAAVANYQGVDDGSGRGITQQELDKLGNSPLWWRGIFVVGVVLLSVTLLVFLLKFLGLHRDWWPL